MRGGRRRQRDEGDDRLNVGQCPRPSEAASGNNLDGQVATEAWDGPAVGKKHSADNGLARMANKEMCAASAIHPEQGSNPSSSPLQKAWDTLDALLVLPGGATSANGSVGQEHHLPALIYGLFCGNNKYLPPQTNPLGSTQEMVVENPTFMPINTTA